MATITAIETAVPSDIMSNLILVRIHTDEGQIGCGETYYTPQAVESLIHDWMAERMLGADAACIESHWRFLYERCTAFKIGHNCGHLDSQYPRTLRRQRSPPFTPLYLYSS